MQRLSRKQQEAFLFSTARVNILEGPVRSGKSFTAILKWLDFCATGPAGPLVICGRTDKTIQRNIILPLQDLVGRALIYKRGRGEVHLSNRVMHVVGADNEASEAKIRGSEFAGALIDETSLMPESFFKMLLSRLSITGAQLFASTNPDGPFHWLKRDFIDRESELDLKVFSFKITDNPSLSEKFIEDLSKEYRGLWHKRFIEGKWVLAEGAVYDFFDQSIHVIPHPPGSALYHILGCDYGTTNPQVYTLIGYNPSLYPNIWLEKEYYYDSKATMRQKSDYEYVQDLMEFIEGYNVKAIYVDPSAASFKQEMARQGVKGVCDANNDVLTGIRFQSQLLSNGTFKICSCCTEAIKEYTMYMWDSKASEKGMDAPVKRWDHACVVAETLVHTTDGLVRISDLRGSGRLVNFSVGDRVFEEDGFFNPSLTRENADVFELELVDGTTLRATGDHLILTDTGYKMLKDLTQSDRVVKCATNISEKRGFI